MADAKKEEAKAKGAEAVSVDKPKGPSVSYAAPVAEQKALAKSGNLDGAIANLLQLEKTARLVRPRLGFSNANAGGGICSKFLFQPSSLVFAP